MSARWLPQREERLFFAGLLTGGYAAGWRLGAFSLATAVIGWLVTAAVLLAFDAFWNRYVEPTVIRCVGWLFNLIDGRRS